MFRNPQVPRDAVSRQGSFSTSAKSPVRSSNQPTLSPWQAHRVLGMFAAEEAASMLKKTKRHVLRKTVLHLPDLDHAKTSVLNSLSSPRSRRKTISLRWSSSSTGTVRNQD